MRSLRLAVRSVITGDKALAAVLGTPSPALLLANALLPRVDGTSVVRHMRAAHINVPAILLGDSPELIGRLRALRIPHTEIFPADVDREELRAAISRLAAPAIEGLSTKDKALSESLLRTRSLDRPGGSEPLVRDSARVERGRLSVVLFEVDQLPRINDQYGHAVGDQMLAEAERVITGLQRASDIAIRWEGDEFLVLMPDVDEKEACGFAERVESALPLVQLPNGLVVSVTVGTAEMTGGESIQDTIGRADQWLYRAKTAGRIPRG